MRQEDLALLLKTKKNIISNYERDISKPKYESLIQIADIFEVTIDDLLRLDLSKNKPKVKNRITETFYSDKEESKSNPIVPIKAQAGYPTQFFIDEIEDIKFLEMPFFHTHKHKRTFEVEGDSMIPIFEDGDYVVCEEVQLSNQVKDNQFYIFVSYDDGVVLKSAFNDKNRQLYQLISANTNYPPIIRTWKEIKEVWEVKYRISKHSVF